MPLAPDQHTQVLPRHQQEVPHNANKQTIKPAQQSSSSDSNYPPKSNSSRWENSYKKYQAHLPPPNPQLPPIEAFQLDAIINGPLKEESQAVVNELLNVTSNFQNDLRLEIRHKLSIEQKIQFKNIEIAKLAHSLNKTVSHKRKKLIKAVTNGSNASASGSGSTADSSTPNMIDSEINQLLKTSIDVSDSLKKLSSSLSTIDALVFPEVDALNNPESSRRAKYPHVYRIINGSQSTMRDEESADDVIIDEQDQTNEINIVEDYTNNSKIIDADGDEDMEVYGDVEDEIDDVTEEAEEMMDITPDVIEQTSSGKLQTVHELQESPNIEPRSASKSYLPGQEAFIDELSPASSHHNEDKNAFSVQPVEPRPERDQLPSTSLFQRRQPQPGISTPTDESTEDMDPESFELFMSSTISKYREKQSRKFSSSDPFTQSEASSSISKNEKAIDKNLLTPLSGDIRKFNGSPFKHSNNPINLLYSSLLSNQNYMDTSPLQDTPFSNILSVKSPATIKSTLQTSHFKKLRINGSPITSDTYKKAQDKNCECGDTENSATTAAIATAELSSPHKILAESLLDNLRLSSDDEIWNSSGLNTETEEDDEEDEGDSDPLISSESSDSDSSEDEAASNGTSIASTNQYYHTLKSDLKSKKKKLRKNGSALRQRRRRRTRSFQSKDFSPTPKHKPSHHILKPKRSILKPSNSQVKLPKDTIKKNAAFTSQNFDKKYSNGRSALSAINKAYDSRNQNSVSNFTVAGTIINVGVGGSEDSDVSSSIIESEDVEVTPWDGKTNATQGHDDNSDAHSIRSLSRLKDYIQ
ncbi:uncharacterized protein RJT20DRAFT_134529 [Scheffersomyces xylosifermentans]|uniref:uncharacterized protein n=1 Tax=Scheffersomyces xylosifermentans TaxID=1304137 RepID=UPI00315C7A47